jgi:metallo-beta-lactamase family protein
LGDGDGFRFWDARHIVGSASVELALAGQRILLSGDIGSGSAIQCTEAEIGGYDQIICESTYGDRAREPVLITERREQLAGYVEETMSRNGNLLIPAFAVERTQVVLEDLIALFEGKRLKPYNVFVDSPLAERVTRATQRHRHGGYDLLSVPNIHFTHDIEESKQIKSMTGVIIVAGSGMCQGGRIRHHLLHNLPHKRARVLLVGYQVAGTLGSVLRDGAHHVRISGHDVPVRADIRTLDSYSTYADRPALLDWIKSRSPVSGSVFLVHGEAHSLTTFADDIRKAGIAKNVVVPMLGETWAAAVKHAATRLGEPRSDLHARIKPRTGPQVWRHLNRDLRTDFGRCRRMQHGSAHWLLSPALWNGPKDARENT